MKNKNERSTEQLVAKFLADGGVVTICKPKLAPKRRASKKSVFTRDQIRSALGHRPLSQSAKVEAA